MQDKWRSRFIADKQKIDTDTLNIKECSNLPAQRQKYVHTGSFEICLVKFHYNVCMKNYIQIIQIPSIYLHAAIKKYNRKICYLLTSISIDCKFFKLLCDAQVSKTRRIDLLATVR
jgi:hypothetical protein